MGRTFMVVVSLLLCVVEKFSNRIWALDERYDPSLDHQ